MKKNKLDIVYEDKSIIVINKPAHMLTISTDNEKEKTLFLFNKYLHNYINYFFIL